uniref:Transcriptional regulator n=1 Tax=Globodera pallida TaxID=36090 RepID=A0A183C8R6_GLOPA
MDNKLLSRIAQEVTNSTLALLKMVMHARSGGNIEIMGLMQARGRQHAHRYARFCAACRRYRNTGERTSASLRIHDKLQ